MSKQLTDAKRQAIKRYDATHTKQYHLKLNIKEDAEIIQHLDRQSNKQGYIKDLILADIKKSR